MVSSVSASGGGRPTCTLSIASDEGSNYLREKSDVCNLPSRN